MSTATIVESNSDAIETSLQTTRSVTAKRRSKATRKRQSRHLSARGATHIKTAVKSATMIARSPSHPPDYSTPAVQQMQLPQPKERPRRRNRFFESITLEKCLVMFGFLVAFGMVLIFGIDLATGWPFWRASIIWDISAVFCGSGLAYLSWDTYRDFR